MIVRVTALALLCGTPLVAQGFLPRPHVLFLFADDQRADTLGSWGNRYIKTPNLDRLARRGLSFRRTYCMGSQHGAVCAPSRTMLLTGRSLHRVYSRIADFPILPELLRNVGYTTFMTGKWHFGKRATCRGWDRARSVLFGGMSDHNRVPTADLQQDGRWSKPRRRGFSSTVFANEAISYLEDQAKTGGAKPFFAYVSFTAPHDPRTPPPGWRRYDPESLPLPRNYRGMHPFNNGAMAIREEKLGAWPRTPAMVREQLAEYYGLITHLDHEVGRILAKLRELQLAANTYVVYAADHGLAVGSHGLLGKQNLYEHSMQAPLIIAGQDIKAGSTNAFAYLFDLFPTILEWAGAPIPKGTDGLSLSPLWQGGEWQRKAIYTSYAKNIRAVRDDRYKLLRYLRVDRTQLFDLQEDPHEMRNLWGLPQAKDVAVHMRALLAAQQKRWSDPLGWTGGKPMGPTFTPPAKRRSDGAQPAWVRRKYFRSATGVATEDGLTEDFAQGDAVLDRFVFTDPKAWKIAATDSGNSLELLGKSKYRPPVRSPTSIALIKGVHYGDFVLDVELEQTGREYGHRDLCVFFGVEAKDRFYYVHLASKADDHAHNIFAVDGKPRVKIASKTTAGIKWGDGKRHRVRVRRVTGSGQITVWFDDMETPIMQATDRRFVRGQIGFGSFDDSGKVHRIAIEGRAIPAGDVEF